MVGLLGAGYWCVINADAPVLRKKVVEHQNYLFLTARSMVVGSQYLITDYKVDSILFSIGLLEKEHMITGTEFWKTRHCISSFSILH